MDEEISSEFTLDGIVTLVDAAHIDQQLGRSDESSEQVAFADVLVLNKTDLVSDDALDTLESRLRDMNRMTRIIRARIIRVIRFISLNLDSRVSSASSETKSVLLRTRTSANATCSELSSLLPSC